MGRRRKLLERCRKRLTNLEIATAKWVDRVAGSMTFDESLKFFINVLPMMERLEQLSKILEKRKFSMADIESGRAAQLIRPEEQGATMIAVVEEFGLGG